MPSPFPGMDPYLEAHWRDVHARLIIYTSDALQGFLPGSLRARVEERVSLETPEGIGPHGLYPDVRVVEYASKRGDYQPETNVALAEPIMVDAQPEPIVETFLQIIDRASGNRVVTVIEILSPSNKFHGPNRELYLRKQREVCNSDCNLVEINLNRYGLHTLAFPLDHLRARFRTPYMTSVRRVTRPIMAEVYRMPLSQRLPIIKVPLRADDADVPLDLQALVDQCYRNGAYEGTLNYTIETEPPLMDADRTWAAKHLRELGLRKSKEPPRRKRKPNA